MAARRQTMRQIGERIEAAGRMTVGALDVYPAVAVELATRIAVDAAAPRPEGPAANALVVSIDHRALETLAVPLLAGRGIGATDVDTDAAIGLVSAELARRHFGAPAAAIGRRLAVGIGEAQRVRQIVGVTGDVRDVERERGDQPRVWVPLSSPQRVAFVVRTGGDPAAAAAAIRAAARAIAPDVPVESLEPYQAAIDRRTGGDRVMMGMLIAFSAVALFFAATGLYGIVALSVNLRRAEFGTRVALGAQMRDVIGMVIGQAFRLLAVGLAFGVAGGLLAANAMRRLLYGVTPADPVNLLSVVGLLAMVTLAASLAPAIRAARVDVMQSLRSD
jgi:hypothetical protein